MKKKAMILLVEDERMDIELTLDAFRETRLDNEVHVVQTGEEALDYLFGRGRFQDRVYAPLPDFILLDIKLPGISGLDVLQTIKQTPKLKRIPVIILTSSKEQQDRITSYDNGVNSYLVKPITFSGFLEVVESLCEYWLTLNINAPNDD
ncbi:MAG: response regulator [Deltaproteobacteria bacterium]|nr:response regulator [Deltaproteobacteria bacterium]